MRFSSTSPPTMRPPRAAGSSSCSSRSEPCAASRTRGAWSPSSGATTSVSSSSARTASSTVAARTSSRSRQSAITRVTSTRMSSHDRVGAPSVGRSFEFEAQRRDPRRLRDAEASPLPAAAACLIELVVAGGRVQVEHTLDVVADQRHGFGRQTTVLDHAGALGQELVDERNRDGALGEVAQQPGERLLHLRLRPVVAAAVAVAEGALAAHLVGAAAVVRGPVLRIAHHDLVEHVVQARRVGARPPAQHLPLDLLEGEHRLTERKRQPGAHLEDGKMVLDQLPQRLGALVVGRVSLVDQPRPALHESAETARRRAVVGGHGGIAELDTGLHHHGDDALPRVGEAGAPKRLTGQVECALHILHGCHGEPGLADLLTAGGGYLGADDVERRRRAGGQPREGRLGSRAQFRGPLRGDPLGQRRRRAAGVVGAAHAGIEMDLRVPGRDAAAHQLVRMRHRLARREAPPRVRPQMVAAQEHAIVRQAGGGGQRRDLVAERRRGHPRIAAGLVDLVGRGLDADEAVAAGGVQQRRLEDEAVGGADGSQPQGSAAAVGGDDLAKEIGGAPCPRRVHGSHSRGGPPGPGSSPAITVSASASVGWPATPPGRRAESEPQATPSARLRLTSQPWRRAQRKPASKVSPAPTVSATSTAGAVTCTRRQPSRARAPSAPSLITGSGPRAARTVAATAGSGAPLTAAASAPLTKSTSTAGSTSASPPSHVSAGSQFRSSDVPAPEERAASKRPRRPGASRGCRKKELACTCRAAPTSAARHVHASSFFLQPRLAPGLRGLFEAARSSGAGTSLDLNWDPAETWDGGLADVLPAVDVLFVNAAEAAAVSGAPDPAVAATVLAARGPLPVIKLGADGALAHDGCRLVHVTAPAVDVADTVGAGDTFDAGFLCARLQGWDVSRSLALGVACGSLSARRPGGVAGQPTLAEALTVIEGLLPGPGGPPRECDP